MRPPGTAASSAAAVSRSPPRTASAAAVSRPTASWPTSPGLRPIDDLSPERPRRSPALLEGRQSSAQPIARLQPEGTRTRIAEAVPHGLGPSRARASARRPATTRRCAATNPAHLVQRIARGARERLPRSIIRRASSRSPISEDRCARDGELSSKAPCRSRRRLPRPPRSARRPLPIAVVMGDGPASEGDHARGLVERWLRERPGRARRRGHPSVEEVGVHGDGRGLCSRGLVAPSANVQRAVAERRVSAACSWWIAPQSGRISGTRGRRSSTITHASVAAARFEIGPRSRPASGVHRSEPSVTGGPPPPPSSTNRPVSFALASAFACSAA